MGVGGQALFLWTLLVAEALGELCIKVQLNSTSIAEEVNYGWYGSGFEWQW